MKLLANLCVFAALRQQQTVLNPGRNCGNAAHEKRLDHLSTIEALVVVNYSSDLTCWKRRQPGLALEAPLKERPQTVARQESSKLPALLEPIPPELASAFLLR